MPLTCDIPKRAMPAVKILRKTVARPTALPSIVNIPATGHKLLRFRRSGYIAKCPLGLVPGAMVPTPTTRDRLPDLGFTQESISVFTTWWDSQDDPVAATDAVWPPEET